MSGKTKGIDDFSSSPELIEGFIAEAREHLANVENHFLILEEHKDHVDPELLNTVFRSIHSVKGAAGFLGFEKMTALAHVMETLLSRMRAGEILPESENIDALLAGVDLLGAMLDNVDHCNEVDITAAHARLSGLLDSQPKGRGPNQQRPTAPTPEGSKDPGASVKVTPGVDFSSTLRIQVGILDQLMAQAGELVLLRNQHLLCVDGSNPASRAFAHQLDLVTTELQELVISTRMQPIGKIFGKFPRMVRELGKTLGKEIQIDISGSEADLDKAVLESLTDPLTHIIRNCCGHGIEAPEERIRAGKPKTGRISLSAYHEAGRISIKIRDDGRGINPELIRRKALEKGLKTEAELEQMEDKDILYLVFLPGFSTAEKVDNVSGRGVGMDVVKTGIEKLGGSFDLTSSVGQGTLIHLRLPLTLAIIPSLIVVSGGNLYAIPQISMVELVCLYDDEVKTRIECADDQEVYRLRNRLLPIVRLPEVLARPRRFDRETKSAIVAQYHQQSEKPHQNFLAAGGGQKGAHSSQSLSIAVVRAGNDRYGLVVDRILGTEEIVVKPLHRAIKSLGIYSGATIMGNGKCALILDVENIAKHADIQQDIDSTRTKLEKSISDEDLQTVLIFKSGEKEQFGMALPMIRRIEPISMHAVERVGEREYITVDGRSTRVLRLDQIFNVSPVVEQSEMYLILPRHIKRPVGILVSRLIDIEKIAGKLDVESFPADGLAGTAIVRQTMTLFIDIYRLIELFEPGGVAARQENPSMAAAAAE